MWMLLTPQIIRLYSGTAKRHKKGKSSAQVCLDFCTISIAELFYYFNRIVLSVIRLIDFFRFEYFRDRDLQNHPRYIQTDIRKTLQASGKAINRNEYEREAHCGRKKTAIGSRLFWKICNILIGGRWGGLCLLRRCDLCALDDVDARRVRTCKDPAWIFPVERHGPYAAARYLHVL